MFFLRRTFRNDGKFVLFETALNSIHYEHDNPQVKKLTCSVKVLFTLKTVPFHFSITRIMYLKD